MNIGGRDFIDYEAEMTRERMLRPYRQPEIRADRGGNAEWLALGDKPKSERLAAIPGSTAWERRSC